MDKNWEWQINLFVKGAKKKMTQPQILWDCEATGYLWFCHLAQFFMELSDYYDAPTHEVLHLIRSVGLIKG
jgi:hypothetical protein